MKQEQEQEQDSRVDTMGGSTDSPTAAVNQAAPATAPLHSPLRLEVDATDKANLYLRPIGTGWLSAVIPRDMWAAQHIGDPAERAEFIVRACNAHDDLLAALKALVEHGAPRPLCWHSPECDCRWHVAIAAINKAEGR